MIITAAYSGTLKAFLMKAELTKPISTVEELVESGLSWEMVLYEEDVETELSLSKDPILKKFWDKKVVVPPEGTTKDLLVRVILMTN